MTVTIIRAAIIYVFVVMAVRIMGKRQIGELKPHELVITFLVSQIAAIPLEDNSMPLANSLIPLMLLISLEIITSVISMKSLWFRNLLQGRPQFVIRRGKLNEKQLKKLRFTIDDLVDAVRQKDVFDINDIEEAVIETNGSVSVMLKPEKNPVTPDDLLITPDNAGMPITIVMDGKPVTEYFGGGKIKLSEIKEIIESNGYDINGIMLLTVDDEGNTFLFKKEDNK